MNNSINDIIQILQISIAPTVLISGVGLLILSLNTRSALIFDRLRLMLVEYSKTKEEFLRLEIELLYKRVKILRISLLFLVLSIIADVLVIISIFLIKLIGSENGMIIPIIFVATIILLIVGLSAFIHDININLNAMRIEKNYRMK